MSDIKIKRLLNKEADKLLREKKYDLLQQKKPVKQKPGSKIKELTPALSAVFAVLFIAAFAVVCYIPVAIRDSNTNKISSEISSDVSETTENVVVSNVDITDSVIISDTKKEEEFKSPDEYPLSQKDEKFYDFLVETIEIIWEKEMTNEQKHELRRCIAGKVFNVKVELTREFMINEGIVDETFPKGYFG